MIQQNNLICNKYSKTQHTTTPLKRPPLDYDLLYFKQNVFGI